MGISYHISLTHDLYRIDQYDPKLVWSIRTTQVLKTILDNIDDTYHIVLDGRGNARYSAKLCRFISDNLYCENTILASVNPEFEIDAGHDNYNTLVDYAGMCDWQRFYTELTSQNIDFKSIKLDSILLMLANRPSELRAEYIKTFKDMLGDKCKASFGCREDELLDRTSHYTKIMHPYPYPLLLDGVVSRSPLEQHRVPGHELFSSLLQVVLETFEFDEKYVFITEKTFKCFAWHQIPIFVCTPGHVAKVRELGFDVFDDVFDNHKYDDIKNEIHYKMKVISSIKDFIKRYPTIEDCMILREKLWSRLVKNNQHLQNLVDKHKSYQILDQV